MNRYHSIIAQERQRLRIVETLLASNYVKTFASGETIDDLLTEASELRYAIAEHLDCLYRLER